MRPICPIRKISYRQYYPLGDVGSFCLYVSPHYPISLIVSVMNTFMKANNTCEVEAYDTWPVILPVHPRRGTLWPLCADASDLLK